MSNNSLTSTSHCKNLKSILKLFPEWQLLYGWFLMNQQTSASDKSMKKIQEANKLEDKNVKKRERENYKKEDETKSRLRKITDMCRFL